MAKQKISIRTNQPLDKISKVFRVKNEKMMSDGTGSIGGSVSRNIYKETPKKTGRLAKSQKLRKLGKLSWQFEETEPYAKIGQILRAGVSPQRRNPILPVRKRALANREDNFGPVAAVYNHPGIKKNDYWTRGIEKSQGDIKKESEKAGIDIAAEYKF